MAERALMPLRGAILVFVLTCLILDFATGRPLLFQHDNRDALSRRPLNFSSNYGPYGGDDERYTPITRPSPNFYNFESHPSFTPKYNLPGRSLGDFLLNTRTPSLLIEHLSEPNVILPSGEKVPYTVYESCINCYDKKLPLNVITSNGDCIPVSSFAELLLVTRGRPKDYIQLPNGVVIRAGTYRALIAGYAEKNLEVHYPEENVLEFQEKKIGPDAKVSEPTVILPSGERLSYNVYSSIVRSNEERTPLRVATPKEEKVVHGLTELILVTQGRPHDLVLLENGAVITSKVFRDVISSRLKKNASLLLPSGVTIPLTSEKLISPDKLPTEESFDTDLIVVLPNGEEISQSVYDSIVYSETNKISKTVIKPSGETITVTTLPEIIKETQDCPYDVIELQDGVFVTPSTYESAVHFSAKKDMKNLVEDVSKPTPESTPVGEVTAIIYGGLEVPYCVFESILDTFNHKKQFAVTVSGITVPVTCLLELIAITHGNADDIVTLPNGMHVKSSTFRGVINEHLQNEIFLRVPSGDIIPLSKGTDFIPAVDASEKPYCHSPSKEGYVMVTSGEKQIPFTLYETIISSSISKKPITVLNPNGRIYIVRTVPELLHLIDGHPEYLIRLPGEIVVSSDTYRNTVNSRLKNDETIKRLCGIEGSTPPSDIANSLAVVVLRNKERISYRIYESIIDSYENRTSLKTTSSEAEYVYVYPLVELMLVTKYRPNALVFLPNGDVTTAHTYENSVMTHIQGGGTLLYTSGYAEHPGHSSRHPDPFHPEETLLNESQPQNDRCKFVRITVPGRGVQFIVGDGSWDSHRYCRIEGEGGKVRYESAESSLGLPCYESLVRPDGKVIYVETSCPQPPQPIREIKEFKTKPQPETVDVSGPSVEYYDPGETDPTPDGGIVETKSEPGRNVLMDGIDKLHSPDISQTNIQNQRGNAPVVGPGKIVVIDSSSGQLHAIDVGDHPVSISTPTEVVTSEDASPCNEDEAMSYLDFEYDSAPDKKSTDFPNTVSPVNKYENIHTEQEGDEESAYDNEDGRAVITDSQSAGVETHESNHSSAVTGQELAFAENPSFVESSHSETSPPNFNMTPTESNQENLYINKPSETTPTLAPSIERNEENINISATTAEDPSSTPIALTEENPSFSSTPGLNEKNPEPSPITELNEENPSTSSSTESSKDEPSILQLIEESTNPLQTTEITDENPCLSPSTDSSNEEPSLSPSSDLKEENPSPSPSTEPIEENLKLSPITEFNEENPSPSSSTESSEEEPRFSPTPELNEGNPDPSPITELNEENPSPSSSTKSSKDEPSILPLDEENQNHSPTTQLPEENPCPPPSTDSSNEEPSLSPSELKEENPRLSPSTEPIEENSRLSPITELNEENPSPSSTTDSSENESSILPLNEENPNPSPTTELTEENPCPSLSTESTEKEPGLSPTAAVNVENPNPSAITEFNNEENPHPSPTIEFSEESPGSIITEPTGEDHSLTATIEATKENPNSIQTSPGDEDVSLSPSTEPNQDDLNPSSTTESGQEDFNPSPITDQREEIPNLILTKPIVNLTDLAQTSETGDETLHPTSTTLAVKEDSYRTNENTSQDPDTVVSYPSVTQGVTWPATPTVEATLIEDNKQSEVVGNEYPSTTSNKDVSTIPIVEATLCDTHENSDIVVTQSLSNLLEEQLAIPSVQATMFEEFEHPETVMTPKDDEMLTELTSLPPAENPFEESTPVAEIEPHVEIGHEVEAKEPEVEIPPTVIIPQPHTPSTTGGTSTEPATGPMVSIEDTQPTQGFGGPENKSTLQENSPATKVESTAKYPLSTKDTAPEDNSDLKKVVFIDAPPPYCACAELPPQIARAPWFTEYSSIRPYYISSHGDNFYAKERYHVPRSPKKLKSKKKSKSKKKKNSLTDTNQDLPEIRPTYTPIYDDNDELLYFIRSDLVAANYKILPAFNPPLDSSGQNEDHQSHVLPSQPNKVVHDTDGNMFVLPLNPDGTVAFDSKSSHLKFVPEESDDVAPTAFSLPHGEDWPLASSDPNYIIVRTPDGYINYIPSHAAPGREISLPSGSKHILPVFPSKFIEPSVQYHAFTTPDGFVYEVPYGRGYDDDVETSRIFIEKIETPDGETFEIPVETKKRSDGSITSSVIYGPSGQTKYKTIVDACGDVYCIPISGTTTHHHPNSKTYKTLIDSEGDEYHVPGDQVKSPSYKTVVDVDGNIYEILATMEPIDNIKRAQQRTTLTLPEPSRPIKQTDVVIKHQPDVQGIHSLTPSEYGPFYNPPPYRFHNAPYYDPVMTHFYQDRLSSVDLQKPTVIVSNQNSNPATHKVSDEHILIRDIPPYYYPPHPLLYNHRYLI